MNHLVKRPSSSVWDQVTGWVKAIRYHGRGNGFSVLQVQTEDHPEPVTVLGYAASLWPGDAITVSGCWTNHPIYGSQLEAHASPASFQLAQPTTTEAIETYLASLQGIGASSSRRLVEAFGEQALDVIERQPHRLAEVEGLRAEQAARITDSWAEHMRSRRTITQLYEQLGLPPFRAAQIDRTYGEEAIEKLQRNPYRLIRDLSGVTFQEADRLALWKLGFTPNALIRLRTGITETLHKIKAQGHCGLPRTRLCEQTLKLLELGPGVVDPQRLDEALQYELDEGWLIERFHDEGSSVIPVELDRAEHTIARRLLELASGAPSWPEVAIDQALCWAASETGLELAQAQAEAVRLALTSKVTVITGGPGVGKTTVLASILTILDAQGVAKHLCAPTGQAAKRMSEATGYEASTIHRLLGITPFQGDAKHGENNPLGCDLLVLDEASMVDVHLMQALLRALPDHAALLILGDADQLPSIGPGQVLADIIHSAAVPVARLNERFRHSSSSRIPAIADDIRRGQTPDLDPTDADAAFTFIRAKDDDDTAFEILEAVTRRIPRHRGLDPIDDVQVLCPTKGSHAGVKALNPLLQQYLNPPNGRARIEHRGGYLFAGDKVLQTENNYDKAVFNGQMGRIETVDARLGLTRCSGYLTV